MNQVQTIWNSTPLGDRYNSNNDFKLSYRGA